MHMVGHQVPFLYSAFPLLRYLPQYRSEVPSKFSMEHLSSALPRQSRGGFSLTLIRNGGVYSVKMSLCPPSQWALLARVG